MDVPRPIGQGAAEGSGREAVQELLGCRPVNFIREEVTLVNADASRFLSQLETLTDLAQSGLDSVAFVRTFLNQTISCDQRFPEFFKLPDETGKIADCCRFHPVAEIFRFVFVAALVVSVLALLAVALLEERTLHGPAAEGSAAALAPDRKPDSPEAVPAE